MDAQLLSMLVRPLESGGNPSQGPARQRTAVAVAPAAVKPAEGAAWAELVALFRQREELAAIASALDERRDAPTW